MNQNSKANIFFSLSSKEYGSRYTSLNNPRDLHFQRRRTLINVLLSRLSFASAIDLGCGSGEIISSIIENNEIPNQLREVHLLDQSAQMLKLAIEKVENENIKLNSECTDLCIENIKVKQKFELILCIGLMAYIPDLYELGNVFKDLSAENTKVIIQISRKNHPLNIFYRLYMRFRLQVLRKLKKKDHFIYTNYHSYDEIQEIMQSIGYTLIRKRIYGIDLPGFSHFKFLLKVSIILQKIDNIIGTDMLLVYSYQDQK